MNPRLINRGKNHETVVMTDATDAVSVVVRTMVLHGGETKAHLNWLNYDLFNSVSGEKHKMGAAEQQRQLQPGKHLGSTKHYSNMEAEDVDNDTGLGMEVDETQDDNHNSGSSSSQV